MKKIVLWAFCIVMNLPLLAGLVDHGDEFGFPNVNVDAHLKIIALHYFPDVASVLPEKENHCWYNRNWSVDIRQAAYGLNIPDDELNLFIAYVNKPEKEDEIPAPHEKLKEFELYAQGMASLFIDGKIWTEYPPAWKALLELPLEQRRFTTIPAMYAFHRYASYRGTTYLDDIIPKITNARKQGCYDFYGCEYDLSMTFYDLTPYCEIRWKRKLDDYHAMIRDYAMRWKVEKGFRHTNWDDAWCWAPYRGDNFYSGNAMPGLRFNIYMETEENLRELCRRSEAIRDFIVAIGLTNRDMKTARKVAIDVAKDSPLNYPVLALRLPFTEAEQFLADKPEYAQLLALLRIKHLSGMEKVKAIDAYLTKYPDYTPKDMPVTSLALNTHEELNAMAGLALLKEGHVIPALERWMKNGTPEDIGLVAEQILSTDELLAYCRKHVPTADDAEHDITSDQCSRNDKNEYPNFYSVNGNTYLLRNLLARRLMREKRQTEAREWFTGGDTRFFSELFFYLNDLKNNPKTTNETRLEAQLTLAALVLKKGDILFGTLLEPDNLLSKGKYPCIWGGEIVPLTGYKSKIFQKEKPAPNLIADKIKKPSLPRFHYRWIAAEYFRQAAKMTDDPRIKGFCFWKAGTILKYRDTALANDDFRELYAVMPELVKNNWFKSAKEVPDDIRNMNDKLSFFKSPTILLSWKFPFPNIPQTDISTETGLKLKISSLHYDNLQVDIDSDLYALHLAGDKGLPEGYIKCGLYYHQQSYYGMAASYLKKALDVKPDSNLTRYLLGCSLLEIGMWTEGVSLVQYVAEHEQTSQTLLSVASKQMATFYQKGLYGLAPDLDKAESYRQNILFKHHIYRNH